MKTKRSKTVEAIKIETGEVRIFPSLKDFVDYVGCSYVHAQKVISTTQANRYYVSCKGWSLIYTEGDR